MKTKLLTLLLFAVAVTASAQYGRTTNSVFPLAASVPATNSWLPMNFGGTNSVNVPGTNALSFLNDISPVPFASAQSVLDSTNSARLETQLALTARTNQASLATILAGSFDPLGRATEVTNSTRLETQLALTARTNQASLATILAGSFDPLGRATEVTNTTRLETQLALTARTNQASLATILAGSFDPLGRATEVTNTTRLETQLALTARTNATSLGTILATIFAPLAGVAGDWSVGGTISAGILNVLTLRSVATGHTNRIAIYGTNGVFTFIPIGTVGQILATDGVSNYYFTNAPAGGGAERYVYCAQSLAVNVSQTQRVNLGAGTQAAQITSIPLVECPVGPRAGYWTNASLELVLPTGTASYATTNTGNYLITNGVASHFGASIVGDGTTKLGTSGSTSVRGTANGTFCWGFTNNLAGAVGHYLKMRVEFVPDP